LNGIFADTYYYLALVSERDAGHERAVAASRACNDRVLTTAWVLTEVADALASPDQRPAFVRLLQELRRDPNTTIIDPTVELFDAGCLLYAERPDKAWSLTDCISFVVMRQYGLAEALTGDHHFEQAGFRALLRP
jgi:predicted nucleic acid-binding protein